VPEPLDREREARRDERRRQIRRRRFTAIGLVVALPLLAFATVKLVGLLGSGKTKRDVPDPTSSAGGSNTSTVPTPTPKPPERRGRRALQVPRQPARSAVRVPILMYHRVAPLSTATNMVSRDLTVTPQAFRQQIAWLANRGYLAISQEQLFRALYEGAPLPKRPVVITFDDGYVDGATTVLSILAKRKWPATFYVITGRTGQPAFITWHQLQRLDRMGMDIGSHTVGHRELPALSVTDKRTQLVDSRRDLERHLHHPVYWFCYPAGRFDGASVEAVRDAGYLIAVTTRPGSRLTAESPLETPRIRVRGPGSIRQLRQALAIGPAPRLAGSEFP
jgi:peptidoglycan/xylan/chitin deacetylase (PgdA/CDA1 family)